MYVPRRRAFSREPDWRSKTREKLWIYRLGYLFALSFSLTASLFVFIVVTFTGVSSVVREQRHTVEAPRSENSTARDRNGLFGPPVTADVGFYPY